MCEKVKLCVNCNTLTKSNAPYCHNCGAKIKDVLDKHLLEQGIINVVFKNNLTVAQTICALDNCKYAVLYSLNIKSNSISDDVLEAIDKKTLKAKFGLDVYR